MVALTRSLPPLVPLLGGDPISGEELAPRPAHIVVRSEKGMIDALYCLDLDERTARTIRVTPYFAEGMKDDRMVAIWQLFIERLYPDLHEKKICLPILGQDGAVLGDKRILGTVLRISLPTDQSSGVPRYLEEKGFALDGFDGRAMRVTYRILTRELLGIYSREMHKYIFPLERFEEGPPGKTKFLFWVHPFSNQYKSKLITLLAHFSVSDNFPNEVIDRQIESTGLLYPLDTIAFLATGVSGEIVATVVIEPLPNKRYGIRVRSSVEHQFLIFFFHKWVVDHFFPPLLEREELGIVHNQQGSPIGVAPLKEMTLEMDDGINREFFIWRKRFRPAGESRKLSLPLSQLLRV